MYKFSIILMATITLAVLDHVLNSDPIHIISIFIVPILIVSALVRLFMDDIEQSKRSRLLILALCLLSGTIIFALSGLFPDFFLFRIEMKLLLRLGFDSNLFILFILFISFIKNLILWAIIKLFWHELRWSTLLYACLAVAFLSIPPGIILHLELESLRSEHLDVTLHVT